MAFDDSDGATPIEDEELEGLIPGHIQTRKQLNEWEALNIEEAVTWVRRGHLENITTIDSLKRLHQKMFKDTWKWAGQFRVTNKTIGAPKERICHDLKDVCKDTDYWIDHETFRPTKIAARFHHRVVKVHPFPNGNGRHARLAADALLLKLEDETLNWGGSKLNRDSDMRTSYIDALRDADRGDYSALYTYLGISE